MLFRLILLFTVTPFVELALLIEVGKRVGFLATLSIVIVTGIVGSILARSQGLRLLRQIRLDLSAGILPTDALLHGLMILVAGALLITPGLLTDATGFLLLLPPIRSLLSEYIKRWLRRKIQEGTFQVHVDLRDHDTDTWREDLDDRNKLDE
ncbi:MAG: FxsA family protein [Planctomycetes bacterium]|nr:FxsA family protein [Planctomycetota bacterium]